MRIEKIPIACAHVATRGCAGAAAQHHLIDHELAVVFADRAIGCTITRIGRIGARSPFPDIAEHLARRGVVRGNRAQVSGFDEVAGVRIERCCSKLPFELRRQALAAPTRERIGFIEADMRDRRFRIERLNSGKHHRQPFAIPPFPIERRLPAFRHGTLPAV